MESLLSMKEITSRVTVSIEAYFHIEKVRDSAKLEKLQSEYSYSHVVSNYDIYGKIYFLRARRRLSNRSRAARISHIRSWLTRQ